MEAKENLTNAQIGRNSYLQKIEGLIYGEDPKGGFLENNMFYHPVLKFQFPIPQGWNYQNTPDRVQMGPKDGKALMMLMLAEGQSLQQAANAMVQKYSLRVVESREVSVNGLPAVAIVADQVAQQQQQQQQAASVRTLSYLIQYGGVIYHLIGVSAVRDFNNYINAFTSTMQNFKALTDPSKLNKKPERVRLKTVKQTTTLEAALRSYNVQPRRMQEFAILNGMNLKDNVSSGTLIKVIEE